MAFFATLLASPILLVAALVVVGVLFFVGYVILLSLGLVSAVIYGLVGLGVVWLIGMFSREALEKHWWIILLIPALFIFGLISDRIPAHTLSMLGVISVSYSGTSLTDPIFIGFIALLIAVFASLAFLVKRGSGPRRRRRKS